MSALPPEADMLIVDINVCQLPIADMAKRLTQARTRRLGKRS